MQPSAVIVLAEFEDPTDAALIAFEDVGVLGIGAGIDELDVGVRDGRAFVGHAGWGPGQLDAELERGDWILEPARREDAFSAEPAGAVAGRPDPQGRQLRAGGADAARSVGQLSTRFYDPGWVVRRRPWPTTTCTPWRDGRAGAL